MKQQKRPRIFLYIDGSNLFGGMEEMLGPGKYWRVGALLKEVERDYRIDQTFFYGTYMKIDPKGSPVYAIRVRTQKAFFDSAKNLKNVTFFQGHFSSAGKEKGVDVHLAVDMALDASEKKYDEAVLMTGDADLRYAIERVKKIGKLTHLAVLGTRYPFGISPIVHSRAVYDWQGFFKKNVWPSYRNKPKNITIRELSRKLRTYLVK